ncbi:hypothetical protein LRJ81_002650 [Enterococcus faecalis]|nr:hypothetical protein [Enterococcus faecalis]
MELNAGNIITYLESLPDRDASSYQILTYFNLEFSKLNQQTLSRQVQYKYNVMKTYVSINDRITTIYQLN